MGNQTTKQPVGRLAASNVTASLPIGDVEGNSEVSGNWQHNANANGINLQALEQIEILRIQISGSDKLPVSEIKTAIENALSCRLPEAGKFWHSDDCRVHWLTPKEWWVMAPAQSAQTLSQCLKGLPLHATEISDSRFTLAVSGGAAAELLTQGCALNLNESVLTVGSSTVTRLAKIPAMITRTDLHRYEINIDRSYARYLWPWLKEAVNGMAPTQC